MVFSNAKVSSIASWVDGQRGSGVVSVDGFKVVPGKQSSTLGDLGPPIERKTWHFYPTVNN